LSAPRADGIMADFRRGRVRRGEMMPGVRRAPIPALAALLALVLTTVLGGCAAPQRPARTLNDDEIGRVMRREGVQGLSMAIIEHGKVGKIRAFGTRSSELGLPLQEDSVVHAAGLTGAAFAYMVLQLADEGRLDLDAPIEKLLPQPLPAYRERPFDYADLADDPRWRRITPRMLLGHAAGFADHRAYEPGATLRIHFEPGTRYAYSSEGITLLQMVVELGLGLDVGLEMQHRVFDRFGMKHSGMRWRADFAANLADGYGFDGVAQSHERRFRVRASGSMDSTIGDQARLWAGILRGEGLSPAMRAQMVAGWLPIGSAHEFPALDGSQAVWPQKLAAGLGVVTFQDRSGPGWFRGGHDDFSGNLVLCLEHDGRCVVFMSNDVRAERLYPELTRLALGQVDMPWTWEYDW
jgi:CubicO group peptidase (beta-lactamase class C family)